jgi:hypothetical protein
MTALVYLPTDADAFRRLLAVIRDPIGAQLDELAAAYPTAAPEDRPELLAQMAELLTMDPDAVDVETGLESRLASIDAALGAGLDMETVNNLLEEKAEILNKLEQE